MSRARETKISIPCSNAQKAEVERRSQQQGLSTANYLRKLLGWPLEQHGRRKDLATDEHQKSKPAVRVGLDKQTESSEK